ncbi:MAG: hypothetical protein IJW90_02955 [Clostridia bacterium]|nr:hypothetical protein [Clostridia bacterium]
MDTMMGIMDTVGLIITAVFLVFILLSGGLMLLNARKRHWIMSLARFGVVIISAIISVPIAKAIAGAFSGQLCSLVLGNLGTDMEDFIAEAPLAAESVSLLISLVFAPILFIFVFLLVRGLLALVAWIVEKSVPFFKSKPVYNLAISLPVGAVTGFLFAVIVILPLCGTLALGTDAIDAGIEMTQNEYEALEQELKDTKKEQKEYENSKKEPVYGYDYWYEEQDEDEVDYDAEIDRIKESMEDTEETVEMLESFKTITDGPVTHVVGTLGSPLFRWMTSGSVEYEGEKIKVSLTEDVPAIADAASVLSEAAQGIGDGDVTSKDKKALNNALEDILAFDIIACIMSDSIEYVSELWLNDESFFGISCPDMGEMLQPVYNTSLQVMADSDMESIREDVLTVADVLTDLIAAGVTGGDDYEDMMLALAEDDLLDELVTKLEKNKHMSPVALEIKNLSVRLVAASMGDLLKETDQYDPLMDDVAREMTRALSMSKAEQKLYLENRIGYAFAEYDIQVPGSIAVEMSERAMDDLGKDGVIDEHELKDYYINYMDNNA